MKKTIFAIILIFLFGYAVTVTADEPFAPKLKVPTNIKEDSPEYFGVMMLKAAVVPLKSAVGVPPYSGALIINASEGMEMEINGVKQKCLPNIQMLSKDDGDKIISFYKNSLSGYKYMDKFDGMIRAFWKGRDDFNPMDINQTCNTAAVSVSDASLFKDLMPDAKSVIQITYTP